MAQYISKDKVVAEINNWIEDARRRYTLSKVQFSLSDRIESLENLLSFINTLEEKDVDFNEDYIEEIYSHIEGIKDTTDRMTSGNFMHHRAAIKFSANTISKVLELMGLKAQKGE